jgi:hypothetical protein
MKKPFELKLEVKNAAGADLGTATFIFERDGKQQRFTASDLKDPVKQQLLLPGNYKVTVSQKGLETQVREVEITENGTQAPFFLGKVGQKGFYAGKIKVPVEVPEEVLGLRYGHMAKPADIAALERQLTQRYGVTFSAGGKNQRQRRILLPVAATAAQRTALINDLRNAQQVDVAGAVLAESGSSSAFVTERLIVRIKENRTEKAFADFLQTQGARIVAKLLGSTNVYVVTLGRQALRQSLDLGQALFDGDWVTEVEQEWCLEIEEDAFPPTDHLYLEQWHHATANIQNAWAALTAANPGGVVLDGPGDLTYGSENIILAIQDQGIHTTTAPGGAIVAAHPEFSGNVTSGQPKLYQTASFRGPFGAQVPVMDNNNPSGTHGMGCAGGAVAKQSAGVASGIGTEGLAGAAPNARLVGLQHGPQPLDDLSLFFWAAGLQDNVYPTQLAQLSQGVHIISNSWGWTATNLGTPGMAGVQNTYSAAFITLTTFGRKGRGTLMFFSAGNGYTPALTLRPFSTDARTFGIAASTLVALGGAEIHAPYSAFGGLLGSGNELEVVAPSHSAYLGTNPSVEHNPNASFAAISATAHAEGMTAAGRMSATTVSAGGGAGTTINVVSSTNFSDGNIILLGAAGAGRTAHFVTAVDIGGAGTNTLTLAAPLAAAVGLGVAVVGLQGDLPGGIANGQTSLSTPTVAASAQVHVASTAAFVVGQAIFFDTPGGANYLAGTIASITSFEYMTLTANVGVVIPAATVMRGIAAVGTTVAKVPTLVAPTVLEVLSTAGFVIGQTIMIGLPTAVNREMRTIQAINPPNPPAVVNPSLTLQGAALTVAHIVGTVVRVVGENAQTSIVAPAPIAADTLVNVTSSAGFQVGQALVIGNPGAGAGNIEYNVVSAIPSTTSLTLGKPLRAARGVTVSIIGGAPSFTSSFGGTSFATPLTAGISALVLSAKSTLTWIEVRDILRNTAVKIEPGGDPTPTGFWVDVNGVAAGSAGYAGPFYSQNHAFGRVNAQAAVVAALAYNHEVRDLHIRNNFEDDGKTAQVKGLDKIDSPDLWIRTTTPGVDGAAAFPASAAIAGPHQKPLRNSNRWIYMRVHNRGNALPGLAAWARVYLAVVPDEPGFSFPDMWLNNDQPGNIGANNSNLFLLNSALGGTSLLNAPVPPAALGVGIPALGNKTINVQWNAANIPGLPFTHLRLPLVQLTAAADTFLLLASTLGIQAGQQVLIGTPATANYRMRTVAAGSNASRLNLVGTVGAIFPTGTPVIPLSMTVSTTVAVAVAAAALPASTLVVADASAFKIGQYIHVGTPGVAASSEILAISDITLAAGNDTLTLISPATKAIALSADVRLISNPVRTFIVGEVSPHDGLLAGSTFYDNNNISYKEVNLLIDIALRDAANAADLPGTVSLDTAGAAVTTSFRLNLVDPEQLTSERTRIKVTRHFLESALNETVTYRFSGAAWGFDTAPTGGWLTLNAPLNPANAAAPGLQADVHFNGTFAVDSNHNKVSFKVIAGGNALAGGGGAAFICYKDFDIAVFTLPGTAAGLGSIETSKPKFHTWADMSLVSPQTAANAYGPDSVVPTQKFRVTSVFSPAGIAVVPAYAAFTGTVFLQRDAVDASKVNLFLKPLQQSRIGYTAVKYFVYRGLRLSDFLKGSSAADELIVRAKDGTEPAFITYIQDVYSQLQLDRAAAAAPLSSSALGWRPGTQLATDKVDRYFFSSNADFQLPIVPMGMQLGNFAGGVANRFGVEIVLEEGVYQPDLAWARKGEYAVDLSVGGPYTAIQSNEKREEILNYIDPAAYYGMHFQAGIQTPDAAAVIKKGNDLFLYALNNFATKHTVYLDIRNESGYSMDYYGNYGDGSGNQIKVGFTAATAAPSSFSTSGWPILARPLESGRTTDTTPLHLQLRINDNRKPLLFVEWSELISDSLADKFVAGDDLMTAGDFTWSKTIEFASHNVVDPAIPAQKLPVAEVVKLHYFRQLDAATVWPAPVVQTKAYHQNVFGPLETPELFSAPGADISWTSAQDRRFIDNSAAAAPFAYVAERGVAHESDRVIFWASASDRFNTVTNDYADLKGITAGVSTKGNFFDVAYLFRGLGLEIVTVLETAVERKLIKFTRVDLTGMAPENILLLGLMEVEVATLTALAGFSARHERNVQLEEVAGSPFTDAGGKVYRKYKVKIQGQDAATANFKVAQPSDAAQPDIHVYSADGFVFTSAAFGAAQPIPVEYVPDSEERVMQIDVALVDPMIQAAPAIVTWVNDFEAQVAGITNDTSAETNLKNLATTSADDLYALSVTHAKANFDDLPCYHARVRARYLLRRHPYYLGKDAEREAATLIYENMSRNLRSDIFNATTAGHKKILVLGVDQDYLLHIDKEASTVACLALDNENLVSGAVQARLRTAVLPRRYSLLKNGMLENAVQAFFTANSIHMVIVIGQDDVSDHIDVERIASRHRGHYFDNENQTLDEEIGTTAAFKPFYETSAPVAAMVPGPFAAGQVLFYDESAQSSSVTKLHPSGGGANGNANSYPIADLTDAPVAGSGGDFLPNELFYRLCHLKSITAGCTVKVGMLTVPKPENFLGGAITMSALVTRIKNILTSALPSL